MVKLVFKPLLSPFNLLKKHTRLLLLGCALIPIFSSSRSWVSIFKIYLLLNIIYINVYNSDRIWIEFNNIYILLIICPTIILNIYQIQIKLLFLTIIYDNNSCVTPLIACIWTLLSPAGSTHMNLLHTDNWWFFTLSF
jgi:hypothetical protein